MFKVGHTKKVAKLTKPTFLSPTNRRFELGDRNRHDYLKYVIQYVPADVAKTQLVQLTDLMGLLI